ncbi:MAG: M20/M25/M40 family metallo-hydrolase [Chloroflexota bacterium]
MEGLRARVDALVSESADWLIDIRHELHAHPELSNREERTAALVAGHLRELGIDEVRTSIAGHGVVGVLRGGGTGDRVIALRADMDALPVRETSGVPFASTVVDATYPGGPFPVAHACGHDCHVATVLASARVLAGVRDALPGTVMFLPPRRVRRWVRPVVPRRCSTVGPSPTQPSMVFGMHVSALPRSTVGYRVGTQYAASCVIRIEVAGVQAHASTPWLGVDHARRGSHHHGLAQAAARCPPTADPVSIGHVEDVGRFTSSASG